MSSEDTTRDGGREHRDEAIIHEARRQIEALSPDGHTPVIPPSPRVEARPDEPGATGPPPDSFSGYDLVREIHRGGQGVVYQAIQKATKRKVAIKVMREGPFAGPRDRARFEREVQILGQLSHPNIVGIHDSGEAGGHFYYVMDYISGQPLDVYMASRKRSVEETLRLFARICEAVSAAHLRGVIHRDLKPGNIRIDAEGEPHVLDFGLAKTVMGEATGGTHAQVMTVTGQFVGSLPWASPEQAEGLPGKIDIRTDVYSLGVILFQMLTARFPYEVTGAMRGVLDNILRAEPLRPRSLRREINDELETIVLKCLSKERERRYQSAGELLRDIQHYLAGEPIEAKRDSTLYVLRKHLRRYRGKILAGGAVAVSLLVGGGIGIWSLAELNAKDQLTKARQNLQHAELWLEKRNDLLKIGSFLDEALKNGADDQTVYLRWGALHVLQGLEARVEEKPALLAQALNDDQKAHVAAGGRSFLDVQNLSAWVESHPKEGSSTALRAAAALILLDDQSEFHKNDKARAGRAAALLEVADRIDLARGPSSSPPLLPASFYELPRDPLIRNRLPGKSPRQAMLAADENADICWVLSRAPRTLDPRFPSSLESGYLCGLVFDWLFVVTAEGKCRPNPMVVVKAEQAEDDHRIWNLTLNPRVRWHDGRPFTAEDVRFSWQTRLSKRDASPILDVRILGRHEVSIEHAKGRATAEWDMRIPLLPKHRYAALIGDSSDRERESALQELKTKPVGCGPYRIEGRSADSRITLVRWDEYPASREDSAYLKRIVFDVVAERKERMHMLSNGRADVMQLTADEFRWHVNGASFADRIYKVKQDVYVYDYFCWNLQRPCFRDRRVRRALAHAVDLDGLRRLLFSGVYGPCYGLFEGRGFVSESPIDPIAFDPQEAGRLLDEAGWRIREGDSIRRAPNGTPLRFELLVPTGIPAAATVELAAVRLQRRLSAVGVEMELDLQPWGPGFGSRQDNGDFDVCFAGVVGNREPSQDRVRWLSQGEKNYGKYASPEVDRLFEQALRTLDPAEQGDIYRKIRRIVYDDQPYLFLWQKPTLWAFNARVRGVQESAFGPVRFYPGPRAWWVAEEEGSRAD